MADFEHPTWSRSHYSTAAWRGGSDIRYGIEATSDSACQIQSHTKIHILPVAPGSDVRRRGAVKLYERQNRDASR
jgi:hypothetical protein